LKLVHALSHGARAVHNAFLSPGRRLFGPAFSRDYLRFAWRAARDWGARGPGTLALLGHRLDYFNQSDALFLLHEIFVNAAYDFSTANPRPRIIDCGANVGMAVLFFKTRWPDSDVLAFEADPATCARLIQTIEANRLRGVHVERAAVGEREGLVAFYGSRSPSGSMTASLDPSWGGEACQQVRASRLSPYLQGPVDFLKLDVEGAEYGVVRDLVATGAIGWIREAAIEYHELASEPDALAHMRTALEGAGFDVTIASVDAAHRVGLLRARRRSTNP
jgi:FkbM family methyltransferase